jgi:hypothetical protein
MMKLYLILGIALLIMISGCTPQNNETQNSTPTTNPTQSISACSTDADCIPLPSDCHATKCINKKFEANYQKPEVCTMMFAVEAAYSAEDCACVESKCVNVNAEKCGQMSFGAAKQIAMTSNCTNMTKMHFCNEGTGTWWIDLDIQKQGCNPACVINVTSGAAEINWRCTGLITP